MAVFIPPYMGEVIKSAAERKMYDILQQIELKDTYILHSLGLPKHKKKIYGEIDFVVVCPLGVACLEIKGGRVACINGKWIFTDRYGVERQKPEGPFAQVTGNMFSLKEVIKNKFPNNEHMKKALFASGVVFPDIEFTSVGQEIIPEIIYDKRTADITDYLKTMFGYWEKRQHFPSQQLTAMDVKNIVNFLRSEFDFIPTLGDRLNAVETKLVRLTQQQSVVMDALSLNKHLLIEGGAGTGKTMLAAYFAVKEATAGKKVLYLTFNKNLANNINNQMGAIENLSVINIHALFGQYVPVEVDKIKANMAQYFGEELPQKFYEYISNVDQETLETMQYDLLLIDEAQDVMKSDYLYSLDYLLKDGFAKGNWAIFYDGRQNIYNKDFEEGMELIQSYNYTQFKLFVNCRNTAQISAYCAKETGNEDGGCLVENGEEVRTVRYADKNEFKDKITAILKELKAGQIEMNDVVFLGPVRYSGSTLAEAGFPVNDVKEGMNVDAKLPMYATIQGFKGLDAKVVVIVDVDKILPENYAKYMYVAGTRARTLLYVVRER